MSLKKIGENPISEKDQLLDRLHALDTNHPDYEAEKEAIHKQLQKIAEDPNETISAFNLQAENTLAKFDQREHNIALENNRKGITEIWQKINAQADTALATDKSQTVESVNKTELDENRQYELAIYFRQLTNTAKAVKKAIRSINWHSFKQLSRAEKDKLCTQIDRLVNDAKVEIAQQQKSKADTLTINRLVDETRYQIQKIADDRNIKIPLEY